LTAPLAAPESLASAIVGDQGIAVVLVASIVVPLAILTGVCWFFWKHRHDE
jgi:uncharacterized paraquat-inducible protein A